MYETEANHKTESIEQIPADIIRRFQEMKGMVLERTVLPWSEHCTECVWPTCYTTCDLYSPREDGRCRRFADGMVRIDCPDALNSYLIKIRFKQWGKVWTPGNTRLRSPEAALKMERRDYKIGSALVQLPGFVPLKALASQKRYSFKKRVAEQKISQGPTPTSFVVECYNPAAKTIRLSLTMRAVDEKIRIPFQKLIELTPGFHRVRVPFEEISKFLDLSRPFNVDLVPNEDQTETTLYFGMMDFVREVAAHVEAEPKSGKDQKEKKIKCVVWDLDNTMWDGILVEDGPEKLRLKPSIADILKALDERGILLSIASKNSSEEALAVLKRFGIDEYFLCPQISWEPKSRGVQTIAKQLNIGLDTFLFVDDSPFEREEVNTVCPEVRTLDAARYLEIPAMEVCQVPVTDESRERRQMYKVESQRLSLADNFGDDYLAFLRYCNIRLNISPMTRENLPRVHELTQRTNQMNFSGNRYEKSVLEGILSMPHLDTYVLEVEDRFGSYGIVGFSVVDSRTPLMTDLMFSCRVQAKRVEHAFLAYLIRKYIAQTGRDFQANYRKTSRNAPSGKVFDDMLLQEIKVEDGVSRLVFPREREVPDDGIMEVVAQEAVEAVRS